MKKDKAYKEFRRFTDYLEEFRELYNEQERKILSDTWVVEYMEVLRKRHNQ